MGFGETGTGRHRSGYTCSFPLSRWIPPQMLLVCKQTVKLFEVWTVISPPALQQHLHLHRLLKIDLWSISYWVWMHLEVITSYYCWELTRECTLHAYICPNFQFVNSENLLWNFFNPLWGARPPRTPLAVRHKLIVHPIKNFWLCLCQDEKPQSHQTVRKNFTWDRGIHPSSLSQSIYKDLCLKCCRKRRAQQLTEAQGMQALFSVCSLRDDNVITSKPTWNWNMQTLF